MIGLIFKKDFKCDEFVKKRRIHLTIYPTGGIVVCRGDKR